MACKRPKTAYRSKGGRNANGNWPITFNRNNGYTDLKVKVPCNHCIGCKLARSRMWALRCMHEATLHKQNCFLTLTYNDKYLPESGSIDVKTPQLFLKRLRKKYPDKRIRFFQCGEYGDKNSRPHYHMCIFGHDFEDKTLWQVNNGVKLYRSKSLEKLWTDPKTKESLGYSSIGDVTYQSSAYVARYITKKINGDKAEKHYEHVNKETGLVSQLMPERISMSLKPGIGKGYYDKYKKSMFNADSVIYKKGNQIRREPIPSYYNNIYDIENPKHMAEIKAKRKQHGLNNEKDNTDERLLVREHLETKASKKLIRTYENESIQH